MEEAWELAAVSEKPEIRAKVGAQSLELSAKGDFVERLGHQLLDFISPVTEATGLVGTHLRGRRVEVALDATIRARNKLRAAEIENFSVPTNFFIPWLEQVSLEAPEDGDNLIENWANLLASQASNNNPNGRVYSDILSKLSGTHARYLWDLAKNTTLDGIPSPTTVFSEDRSFQDLHSKVWKTGAPLLNREINAFRELVVEAFDVPGIKLTYFALSEAVDFRSSLGGEFSVRSDPQIVFEHEPAYEQYDHEAPDLVYSALSSLRLVEASLNAERVNQSCRANFNTIHLTTLGWDFIKACYDEKT